MANPNASDPLVASILDRLIDNAPEQTQEAPHTQVIVELRDAIRRDLEFLLNTRWHCMPNDKLELAQDPVLVDYGIPDFTSLNLNDEDNRTRLTQLLEKIIAQNESRFKSVKIKLIENSSDIQRTLHFRIDAFLDVEPAEIPVSFDSTVNPATRSFVLKDRLSG